MYERESLAYNLIHSQLPSPYIETVNHMMMAVLNQVKYHECPLKWILCNSLVLCFIHPIK